MYEVTHVRHQQVVPYDAQASMYSVHDNCMLQCATVYKPEVQNRQTSHILPKEKRTMPAVLPLSHYSKLPRPSKEGNCCCCCVLLSVVTHWHARVHKNREGASVSAQLLSLCEGKFMRS
jgi:hypothetical protein